MTRQLPIVATGKLAGNHSLLHPLRGVRNLTREAIDRIASAIRSGKLPPGSRLPTEQELMTGMGVSRTVVREAVSALRANGLVTTRQGSGVFVATDSRRVPFRIDPDGLNSIEDVLGVMELRLALEVEAAALAAERITPAVIAPIKRSLQAIDAALREGRGAVEEDFAFHLAIAAASRNAHFAELLAFLGHHIIPRQSIRVSRSAPTAHRHYLMRIQEEHRRIYRAVCDGNSSEARKTMRTHLMRSLQRYRVLARQHLASSDG